MNTLRRCWKELLGRGRDHCGAEYESKEWEKHMKTEQVYTRSATFQKFEVLKTNRNKRYKYGEFFVEGVRNINNAVENGWQIVSFLYDGDRKLSDWAKDKLARVRTQVNYALSGELLAALSSKEDTSELLAVIKMRDDDFERIPLSENPLIALFDRPSNHGNLGTILRSCDALGVEGLILTGHGVDLYDPDVVSSTMGSFFCVPAVRMSDNTSVFALIDRLKARYPGFQLIGGLIGEGDGENRLGGHLHIPDQMGDAGG